TTLPQHAALPLSTWPRSWMPPPMPDCEPSSYAARRPPVLPARAMRAWRISTPSLSDRRQRRIRQRDGFGVVHRRQRHAPRPPVLSRLLDLLAARRHEIPPDVTRAERFAAKIGRAHV